MMLKCYYAHPITSYGTLQEAIDIAELQELGFVVLNPNAEHFEAAYKLQGMQVFLDEINSCDCVAFRGFPDKSIPAGVGKEIKYGAMLNKPVFELSDYSERILSVEDTRAMLKTLGRK